MRNTQTIHWGRDGTKGRSGILGRGLPNALFGRLKQKTLLALRYQFKPFLKKSYDMKTKLKNDIRNTDDPKHRLLLRSLYNYRSFGYLASLKKTCLFSSQSETMIKN